MSPLPHTPPRREPMSETEKKLRDKLIALWIEKHRVWPRTETWPDMGARYTYWQHRPSAPRCAYTTERMFDGKFWSFKYVWRASGADAGHYVLVSGSIRRHARRKDAKARSLELIKG